MENRELARAARRIGGLAFRGCALMLLCSVLIFLLVNVSPFDPVDAFLGYDVTISAERRQEIVAHWGFDRPLWERYFLWLKSVAEGDWGTSSLYDRPVREVVWELFKTSIVLMGAAWVLSGILSFSLGIVAALNRGNWLDKAIKSLSLIMEAMPSFWVGMVLVIVFAVWLGLFPSSLAAPIGMLHEDITLWDRVYHLVLPVMALSINGMGHVVLQTREKMIKSMESDYSLFARARGDTRGTIVLRHNMRNIALPALTLQCASISELWGGAVFVETVFSYPGLGHAAVEAATHSDTPLLAAIAMVSVLFVFLGNLLADFAYTIVDPQIEGVFDD